jgi:hypothetical protein
MKNRFKFSSISNNRSLLEVTGSKMITLPKFIILVCVISILCYCSENGSPKIDIINIHQAVDLSEFKPSLNLEKAFLSMAFAINVWDIDDKGNYYFLDIHNHRVLKFGENRQFLMQFGSIGQEKDSLYYPSGIFLYKGTLFILDQEGKKVKSFSLYGSFLSSFEIKDAFSTESIFIANDEILLSVKCRSNKGYNENRLVSVFSLTGQKLRDFGNVVKSVKYDGYLMFNRVRVFGQGKRVFIPHNFWPLVRIFEGEKEIKTINLLDLELDEINEIAGDGKKRNVDTPLSITGEKGVRSMIYCSGFSPISQKEFYYAANFERNTKSVLFILDENGRCKKRMKFEFMGKPLMIKAIKYKDGDKYCIATREQEQKIYLFKF